MNMLILADIGRNIAQARHLRGDKECIMAKALKIDDSTLSKIECGRYPSLKVSLLLDIVIYLEIPLHEILPPPPHT